MMAASGFAGLGYQIVWTQQSCSWLGHESAAVLAVVAAFFGGLAASGSILGSRIERSLRPRLWYVGCELVIAGWGLAMPVVGPHFAGWVLTLIGAEPSPAWHWTAAFLAAFLLFLPATAAMGVSLPAMERLTIPRASGGRSVAALYAGNTAGAVLGVLASAFWLVPKFGLAQSTVVCVGLNLSCALLALAVFPKRIGMAPNAPTHDRRRARGVLTRLAVTGFLGIGYEVLVVRVLSQVTEDTVYTFALLLAVYLVGSAGGAAGYQRWLRRHRDLDELGDQLLAALGVACLSGTASLWAAERVRAGAEEAFGSGMTGALGAEGLLAVFAFGPATLVMGALFAHLTRIASRTGVSFGRAFGVNTLAAALAPAVCGVLAVPTLGAKWALLSIVLGYLAATRRAAWSKPSVWLPAAVTLTLALVAPPLTFVEIPEGGRVVSYREGVLGAVSVVEDADGVRRLRINNRQQEGSSNSRRVDARQAWLPLLLHPHPRRALFLGLGTGVTASSAAADPTLDVDAVELLPEVIAAAPYFQSDANGAASSSRLHVLAADARRYVRVSARSYDVVVSDNFHPARSGSGALYTVEHFDAVRRRLEPAGVFCQWLPLHQLDLDTLRSIVHSFVAVYPRAWAILATNSLETPVVGLVGRASEERFDAAAVRARVAQPGRGEPLSGLGFEDELTVLGSVVAGPGALVRFSATAPVNTDDLPVVAYRAPRVTYEPDSTPKDRLLALLGELSIEPDELLVPTSDSEFGLRLTAYWRARNRFIESGRNVRPSNRVEEMLAQVREPLLSVLRISPDFRPAYDPLLSMAAALARSDVSSARPLLAELTRLQPARSEAEQLLSQIGSAASSVAPIRH